MERKRERRGGSILSDFSAVKLIFRGVYAETNIVSHAEYAVKPILCVSIVRERYTHRNRIVDV